jgi:hypothetical protein
LEALKLERLIYGLTALAEWLETHRFSADRVTVKLEFATLQEAEEARAAIISSPQALSLIDFGQYGPHSRPEIKIEGLRLELTARPGGPVIKRGGAGYCAREAIS